MSAEFWAMGGYAEFIWPAYIVSLGALLWLGIMSYFKMKNAERRLGQFKTRKD